VDADNKPIEYANREAAILAVPGAQKVSAGFTKAKSMTAGQELYFSLVVYMPTTVENEANYKTSDDANDPYSIVLRSISVSTSSQLRLHLKRIALTVITTTRLPLLLHPKLFPKKARSSFLTDQRRAVYPSSFLHFF
jgi:hypothetical protein